MKNFYVSLLFLFGIVHVASAQPAQQASSYYYKYKTHVALENISSGATTLFGPNAEDGVSGPISFFPFTFAGTEYSTFSVSEDGLVILGTAVYSSYPYDNYFIQNDYTSNPKPVYPVLIAWGEDMSTGQTGSVSYKVVGTAPLRKLVVQFNVFSNEDWIHTNQHSIAPTKSFQLWLREGSNEVQFVYGNIVHYAFNSANIGIAAAGTDFLSVNTATKTVSSTEVFSNEHVPIDEYDLKKKGIFPEEGDSYVFSPNPIADDPTPPADDPVTPPSPITATLSMLPEYPVPGQHKFTIYLGFGKQDVTLSANATGGNPPTTGYSYSWSPATGLSSATAAAPLASPQQTTTYTVVITDGKGNSTQKSITVYVIDPRDGTKYKVCKLGKTDIVISKEAVQAQLNTGASLGECSIAMNPPSGTTAQSGAQGMRPLVGEVQSGRTIMGVYPNPSVGVFTVQLPDEMQQSTITIFDATGKMVAQKRAGENQQLVPMELGNKKPGVYLIKLTGGGRVQTSKIIIK